MNKYPVVKIQFETTVTQEVTFSGKSYTVKSVTRVHYLQPSNTLSSTRYQPDTLKVVLDLKEEEQPYLTGDDVLHAHPSHLKDAQTSVIRRFT